MNVHIEIGEHTQRAPTHKKYSQARGRTTHTNIKKG